MRRSIVPAVAAVLAAGATAGLATAREEHAPVRHAGGSYDLGLWGDVPYSDPQIATGVPNLIDDMNRHRLAFTVHDGDIKAGGMRCDDEAYTRFEGYLGRLDAPALYTPGDNEWTDCDRPAAGNFDAGERLAHLRAELFDTPYSYGRRRIRLRVQAAPYVENRRWHVGPVTYATLHVVGSDDNLGDVAPDPAEHAARSAAAIAWMREAFDRAERRGSAGVMLVMQANPGFDEADPTRAVTRNPQTLEPAGEEGGGYTELLRALREETIAYGRPVVLVHGDSHYFRIDKPLLDAAGYRIQNFTRLETPGDNAQTKNNDVQWVRVHVDPWDREVFSFQQEVVSGNLPPAYQP